MEELLLVHIQCSWQQQMAWHRMVHRKMGQSHGKGQSLMGHKNHGKVLNRDKEQILVGHKNREKELIHGKEQIQMVHKSHGMVLNRGKEQILVGHKSHEKEQSHDKEQILMVHNLVDGSHCRHHGHHKKESYCHDMGHCQMDDCNCLGHYLHSWMV